MQDHEHAEWNRTWERNFVRSYYASGRFQFPPSMKLPEPGTKERNERKHTLLALAGEKQQICDLQKDLCRLAMEKFALGDLENKWNSLKQEERERLVLDGLWAASSGKPSKEPWRFYCPDIRLATMTELHNRTGFLELLRQLIPNDPGKELTEPIRVPHPELDEVFDGPETSCIVKIKAGYLGRCFFITHTLWKILLALYGMRDNWANYACKTFKWSSRGSSKAAVNRAQSEGLVKDIPTACSGCRKSPSELGPEVKLKACAKCQAIGRSIRYCSRECQAEDWKNGSPFPHRQVCGKADLEEADVIPAKKPVDPKKHNRIPLPDPSFKRSPALLHQISLLKIPPFADYILVSSELQDQEAINLPGKPITARVQFWIDRNRALHNGDARAVYDMYRALLPRAHKFGMSDSMLKKQLHNEYGVDIDQASRLAPSEPVDIPEIERVLRMMMIIPEDETCEPQFRELCRRRALLNQ